MDVARDRTRLRWDRVYREADLYKAAVRLYTKPLFNWRKALSESTDQRTLYDFARRGVANLEGVHRRLVRREFQFRPALVLRRNFNGKHRALYVFPWEERLVSLLLYRQLNQGLDRHFSGSSYAYRWRGFGVDRCQRNIARTIRTAGGPLYVVKRDIRDYFASIDHALLLAQLERLIDPNDYLFDLVRQCVRFRYEDGGTVAAAERGVPFGSAIACLLANVYLMPLDHRLEAIPRVRFFRYADDLLVVSCDRAAIERASRECWQTLAELRLAPNPKHEHNLRLRSAAGDDAAYRGASRFRHLGLEFRADGSVGLARDKFRKIRNLFRFALRRNRDRFARRHSTESRAELAINLARRTLERGVRNVAIIDYYLRHVTDEAQLRRLDRWLAEEVLAVAFQRGHKRGHFRRLPYRRLRQMGLPSLVHRRRLIVHGHVDSPFFVWTSYQANRGRGGQAVRSRPTRAAAFSHCPEAVANERL